MAYDPDELLPYKGNMITKEVIFNKVRGLGWNTKLFGQLDDSEIIRVMEERKTPAQMGKTLEATFTPNQTAAPKAIINLDSDEGSDPSVMGPPGTVAREEPPAPAAGVALESGIVAVGVAPPSHAGKHVRPVDPTRVASAPPVRNPVISADGKPVLESWHQPSKTINVKPPKTDTAKLMSMLDAAFQLAGSDATCPTAKVLVQTNGLDRAFQSMYPELAKKVLGRHDMTPDIKCRGGTVLDIEVEADNGYVHIITSAGVITITGNNLIHKGSEA
jgi:hypothetical protein